MDKYEVVHFQVTALIGGPYHAMVIKTPPGGQPKMVSSHACIESAARCNAIAMELAETFKAEIVTPLL